MTTENSAAPMDEWELSKENVQPLKSGRKVEHLTAALQQQTKPNNVDHRQQIILQRQALENELRCYSGDDPIAPWEKYIRWTEETFPRGGKESNMRLLLERCVQLFKDVPRYKNDIRYVSAWLKLAGNFSNDPLEMYQFMRDQGIGFKVAQFYEAWAWQLEQLGNTKKADAVYTEGMNCKAEPEGRLEALHREFQFRVARSTMTDLQESVYDEAQAATENGPQRNVLGGLKGRGKLQKVGSQRTGAAVKTRTAGGLGLQTVPSQIGGQHFSVFCDDAPPQSRGGASALPAPTGEWENMPTQQTRKENDRVAGPWTGGQRSGHRSQSVGLDEASRFSSQNFTVHVDDNPQPITTPHKLPEMGSQVLSVRKPRKQPEDSLKHIKQDIFSSNDSKTRVMYCKHLVYGGPVEMSIEEIRTLKVKAKKDERRLAEEREALRRRQENLQEQQQLMFQKQEEFERKVQERMEQQQLKHEEEMKRFKLQQQEREQELQQQVLMKVSNPQPIVTYPSAAQVANPPTQFNQENNRPRLPMQDVSLKVRAAPMDQENAAPKQPMGDVVDGPVMVHQDNHPAMTMPSAVSRQRAPQSIPLGNHQQSMHHAPAPHQYGGITAPTPEEKQKETVAKAQQQLQALRQQIHHESVYRTNTQNEEAVKNPQTPYDGNVSGVTQQLQFDDVTKTVNMQQVIAAISQPTPTTLSSIPANAPCTTTVNSTTPNVSGIFNTSSNTSWVKTPRDRSLLPDSRGSSHSGRLLRITPSHTPCGIAAPSPTVNTKEALGTIMAMLNNPLDEVWSRPAAAASQISSSSIHQQKFTFENEFAKVPDEVKPATKCVFTIATDEYDHLDDQENNPPKDYVAPQPDPRPRSGILQPSIGVPVMSQEDLEEASAGVPMEQQQHQPQTEDNDNMMEGIEPIKEDDDYRHHVSHHESTLMHQSTHSAFEAAARMASTPFNPQFASERPSFQMSAIKAHMDGSIHRPESNTTSDNHHQSAPFTITSDPISVPFTIASDPISAPFTIAVDPVSAPFTIAVDPVSVPFTIATDPLPAPVAMHPESAPGQLQDEPMTGASRVEATGLESFDVNETTMNPPSRLSPIMETSAEDQQSSASSNGSRSQSQTTSHIQHQLTANNESQGLNVTSRKRNNSSSSSHSSDSHIPYNIDGSQVSSFANRSTANNGTQGQIDQNCKFQIACDDDQPAIHSTSINHQSQLGMMSQSIGMASNGLVGDLSSLMISEHINNHSIHQSRIQPGTSDQVFQDHQSAVQVEQNKSLGNQSVLPAEQHHQSMLNYSACPVEQNRSVLNHSALPVEQNQSMLNHSTHPVEANQSMLNSSSRPVEQNHSMLNHSTLPSDMNQSILNYSTYPVDQSMLNQSAMPGSPTESPLVADPWDVNLKHEFLANLTSPLSTYHGYEVIQTVLPDIEPGLAVSLGNELYTIAKQVGQGAFAKIYSAGVLGTDDFELTGGDKEAAIKVESPACPWEFYISKQIHTRLKTLPYDGIDVTKSVMNIDAAYLFDNGSCLITDLHTEGTLLDLVNLSVKEHGEPLGEATVLYFAIELLHVIEKMHACQIIHGDIKPDNILVANMSDWTTIDSATALLHSYTKYLKLIDMGRGIDMTQFAPGTVFNVKSGTSGFDCIEMQTDRPWTYQTDLYGLAGTLNCMLFGTYMKPYYEGGRWKIACKTKRWYKAEWKDIFERLLNIPSCDELPSLSAIRQHMEETLRAYHMDKLATNMTRLAVLL